MLTDILRGLCAKLHKFRLNRVEAVRVSDVEAYYDAHTDRYIQAYGNILQAARPSSDLEFLDYLIDSIGIQDHTQILDAGCGVCGPSIHFARKKEVTIKAITISQVQVERGMANVSEAGLSERIEVRRGDFHHLGELFSKNSIDTVFFLETLGYARDLRKVLSESTKVLKPGGHIYVKDFFPVPLLDPVQRNWQLAVVKETRREYQYRLLDLVSLIGLSRELGLHLSFAKPLGTSEDFTNASTFDLAGGHGSYTKAITTPYQLFEALELKFRKP